MPSPHKTREIATQASGGTAGINAETLGGTKTLTTNDVVYQPPLTLSRVKLL